MVLRHPVPDEMLNAYVDGALLPAEAAELATRTLDEPALAARIARLHGLKAGVWGLATAQKAPPLPAVPDHRAGRTTWWAVAVLSGMAAGLAVLAMALAPVLHEPAPGGAASDLTAHHDAWALTAAEDAPDAPDWLTDVMASAGLRLVHAAPLPGAGAVHLAFIGRNACRISLFERPDPGAIRPLRHGRDGALLTADWHSGSSGFALVARDMNPDRFATIAGALAGASLTRDRPGRDLVATLAAARQPCLG